MDRGIRHQRLACRPLYSQSAAGLHRHATATRVELAKGKEARHIIKLKSEASDHCYFTEKNKNNSKERIQLRKYDPVVRKHVIYKEASKL